MKWSATSFVGALVVFSYCLPLLAESPKEVLSYEQPPANSTAVPLPTPRMSTKQMKRVVALHITDQGVRLFLKEDLATASNLIGDESGGVLVACEKMTLHTSGPNTTCIVCENVRFALPGREVFGEAKKLTYDSKTEKLHLHGAVLKMEKMSRSSDRTEDQPLDVQIAADELLFDVKLNALTATGTQSINSHKKAQPSAAKPPEDHVDSPQVLPKR